MEELQSSESCNGAGVKLERTTQTWHSPRNPKNHMEPGPPSRNNLGAAQLQQEIDAKFWCEDVNIKWDQEEIKTEHVYIATKQGKKQR